MICTLGLSVNLDCKLCIYKIVTQRYTKSNFGYRCASANSRLVSCGDQMNILRFGMFRWFHESDVSSSFLEWGFVNHCTVEFKPWMCSGCSECEWLNTRKFLISWISEPRVLINLLIFSRTPSSVLVHRVQIFSWSGNYCHFMVVAKDVSLSPESPDAIVDFTSRSLTMKSQKTFGGGQFTSHPQLQTRFFPSEHKHY